MEMGDMPVLAEHLSTDLGALIKQVNLTLQCSTLLLRIPKYQTY